MEYPEYLQPYVEEVSEYSYTFDYKKFGRDSLLEGYRTRGKNFSSLKFISDFDSSNLSAVYLMENNEYDLILNHDINGYGYTSWFNF
jgi:hypothetical protein